MAFTPNSGDDLGQNSLDLAALFWGLICGTLVGTLVALFAVPRSSLEVRRRITRTGQALAAKVGEVVAAQDTVAESIEAGKAAARRRRADLGLGLGRERV